MIFCIYICLLISRSRVCCRPRKRPSMFMMMQTHPPSGSLRLSHSGTRPLKDLKIIPVSRNTNIECTQPSSTNSSTAPHATIIIIRYSSHHHIKAVSCIVATVISYSKGQINYTGFMRIEREVYSYVQRVALCGTNSLCMLSKRGSCDKFYPHQCLLFCILLAGMLG